MAPKIGYVDGVDWQHHLEHDSRGVVFYGDINDLKAENGCWKECGIVKVEIKELEWVEKQDFSKIHMMDEEDDDGSTTH